MGASDIGGSVGMGVGAFFIISKDRYSMVRYIKDDAS